MSGGLHPYRVGGERHTRARPDPHEYETPSLAAPPAGAERPRLYRFSKRVWRRRRPYVLAVVTLERFPMFRGREAAYILEGKVLPATPLTMDGRRSPPLGRVQKAMGAEHLEGLKHDVRLNLEGSGWRPLTEMPGFATEYWQAPEGPALDEAVARRSERALLHGKLAAALDAILDGDRMGAAEFRDVPAGTGLWTVWAEPSRGGIMLRVDPQRPAPADDPEDLCECGDYRSRHEGGTGRCTAAHDSFPCGRFVLFARRGETRDGLAVPAGEAEEP